ncbi:hypothetical protein PUR71_11420 [Streptomyces sp. SP17BM10]|nr:hypothetical protein [Streptomyces sp. SP17BM10]MEE1783512.1 hypothetical protein [Streptomyces sp. SP17BM10]
MTTTTYPPHTATTARPGDRGRTTSAHDGSGSGSDTGWNCHLGAGS